MKFVYVVCILKNLYINYNSTEEVFFPDDYGVFIYD